MRPFPTQAEERSVDALLEAFRTDGHAAEVVKRDRNDSPDWLVKVGGVLIACECTQVPSAYIFQKLYRQPKDTDWQGNDLLCTSWPNEPHQWVAEAIRRKTASAANYIKNTGAGEVWLLLHSPSQLNQSFIDTTHAWIPWALRHGAKLLDHPFSQIFMWTPKNGITTVSVKANEANLHSQLGISFSVGYPALCMNRASIQFSTTTSPADPPNVVNVEHHSKATFTVRPKDPEYAKHPPASRNALYRLQLRAWMNHAEVSGSIEFPDEGELNQLDPMRFDNLPAGTVQFIDYLHDYQAPRRITTIHHIQPYT